MYAQMLVGMVALTGQWWLDVRKPGREEVAAHLVNLGWNGLRGLEAKPQLRTRGADTARAALPDQTSSGNRAFHDPGASADALSGEGRS